MRSLPDAKIRIMILNPSGGAGFNDLVAETVMKYKDPNTHVTVVSLADRIGGTQTLAYPVLRPLVYGEMIRACLQCRKENYDALIVNCFGDPMVDELRQIAGDDMVVLGARQMAVQTVSRLGCRYAVLSLYDMQGSQDPLLQRCLSDTRTAVSHPVIDMAFNDDLTPMNVEGLRESLATQGELAVRQDGAEALILGCTAMFGCWRGLMRAVGVPVIDPTVAALRAAGEAVRLKREFGWGASTKRAGNVPTENQLELIAEQSYPYSGRIEIE